MHSEGGTSRLSGLGSLAGRTPFAGHNFKAPQVGKAPRAADGRGRGRADEEQPGYTDLVFKYTESRRSAILLSKGIIYSMKSTTEL